MNRQDARNKAQILEQQAKVTELTEKYQSDGILKGSEFLLPPDNALLFAKDLEAAEIVMLGVTIWCFVSLAEGTTGIAEEWWAGFAVPDEVLASPDAAQQSAALAKAFIEQLTESDKLVSLDLYAYLTPIPQNKPHSGWREFISKLFRG